MYIYIIYIYILYIYSNIEIHQPEISLWDSDPNPHHTFQIRVAISPAVPPSARPTPPADHCRHQGSAWGCAAGSPPGRNVGKLALTKKKKREGAG